LHGGVPQSATRIKLADHEPPTSSEAVKATLRGIRRAIGAAPARKAPAVAEIMRDTAYAAPTGLKGLRDRALLLLGFGGAFRRSELVSARCQRFAGNRGRIAGDDSPEQKPIKKGKA